MHMGDSLDIDPTKLTRGEGWRSIEVL